MTAGPTPIRVLVVDDSAFMRRVVGRMLTEDGFQVVGTARNGLEALALVSALRPDVVTLDVEMPVLDGLSTLERLMKSDPVPVVMLSSLTQPNAEATIRALTLGAVDFVPKPSGSVSLDIGRVREELARKVRAAAAVPRWKLLASRRPAGGGGTGGRASPPTSPRPSGEGGAGLTRVAVIGSSTGGPSALHRILAELPGDLACGLLVVQHMPTGFTRSLAEHLDGISALQVREAADGDVLADGHCLVAPGGYHLVLAADGTVRLDEGPHRHGVRPSVDVTLESVATVAPGGAVAVILTGMGMDGARGARLLRQRGGTVVAQDEATCVVYGMPRAVVEMGLAHHVVPLHQMAAFLTRLLGAGRARHETSRGPTQATAQGTAQASARVDGGAACRG